MTDHRSTIAAIEGIQARKAEALDVIEAAAAKVIEMEARVKAAQAARFPAYVPGSLDFPTAAQRRSTAATLRNLRRSEDKAVTKLIDVSSSLDLERAGLSREQAQLVSGALDKWDPQGFLDRLREVRSA